MVSLSQTRSLSESHVIGVDVWGYYPHFRLRSDQGRPRPLACSTVNLNISSSSRDFTGQSPPVKVLQKDTVKYSSCRHPTRSTFKLGENHTTPLRSDLLFPPKVISPLRRRRRSCRCSRVCGLLRIDEILDRSDLHVISRRLEREDENRFIGE
jgi:hypothetical protein